MKVESSKHILEKNSKYQISSISTQWELSCSMWTDGRTDGHDEDYSRFSQLCERA